MIREYWWSVSFEVKNQNARGKISTATLSTRNHIETTMRLNSSPIYATSHCVSTVIIGLREGFLKLGQTVIFVLFVFNAKRKIRISCYCIHGHY
jgi:hypothetical protein